MPSELADTFAEILRSLRGIPHFASDIDAAAAIVSTIVSEAQVRVIAIADLRELMEPVRARLAALDIEVLSPPFATATLPDAIDPAQIGITFAQYGIAESATLIEVATDDAMRLVSALPRTHIGIVRTSTLVPRLKDAATIIREAFGRHGENIAVSFISGPSRTGDIEMILTLGVHGPETVHVILIDD